MKYLIVISMIQITFGGQLCLQCRNVVDPGACNTVTTCGTHEECSMTKSVTSNGMLLYDLGCRDSLSCRSTSGRRSATDNDIRSGNYVICEACCNDSVVCNLGGLCGVNQFNFSSGTLCFACDQMTQPDNCGSVTLCSSDKVCHLGQKIVGLSGIKVYEAKCANPHTECPNGVKSGSGAVFGKRNDVVGYSNKRQSNNFCKECCSGHLCNNDCSLSKQLMTTHMPTTIKTTSAPFPPHILDIGGVGSAQVGTDVRLFCSAIGNPKPSIWWNLLQTDPNVKNYHIEGNGHILVIENYQHYNDGKYMCFAQNAIGSDNKIVTLHA